MSRAAKSNVFSPRYLWEVVVHERPSNEGAPGTDKPTYPNGGSAAELAQILAMPEHPQQAIVTLLHLSREIGRIESTKQGVHLCVQGSRIYPKK